MAGQAGPGRLIGGRYRLLARLGAGGMGRVWRATDEALRIEVAVKEVWLPATPGPDADERLRRAEREARNAARLRDHPNVVAVHDVVVEDGVPWTVMQLVAGHTLEEHVQEYGPLSVAHGALVAGALLDALEAAHAAGIVHRDVKPANVMLADDGKVLLTDFGIAIGSTDTALTASGTFLGSVEYIAPERARGTEGLAASDLFSLGVTLFQGVEGFSPFHRETATGTLTAVILDEAPEPVRAGRLTPLLTGLLEKDPAERIGIAEARQLLAARETPPTVSETVGTPVATAPRGATAGTPPRRPTEGGKAGSQGTDQRRRATGPQTTTGRRRPETPQIPDRSRRVRGPETAEPRRPTGTTGTAPRAATAGLVPRSPSTSRVPPTPKISRTPNVRGQIRPARRRGARTVVLFLLVAATIAAVLFTVLKSSAFAVTGVRVGDFVKVDADNHITGKLSESKARTSTEGRRVTAREDRADPDVCKRLHAAGRPDVEQQSAVSFCLVRPAEQAAAPAG